MGRAAGASFESSGGAGGPASELASGATGDDLTLATLRVGKLIGVPATQTIGVAGDTINPAAYNVNLTNGIGSGITLNSTPTIATAGAVDGQLLILQNVSGAGNIVMQDESALVGGKLRLQGGSSKTLGPRDLIAFRYNAAAGEWHQFEALILI